MSVEHSCLSPKTWWLVLLWGLISDVCQCSTANTQRYNCSIDQTNLVSAINVPTISENEVLGTGIDTEVPSTFKSSFRKPSTRKSGDLWGSRPGTKAELWDVKYFSSYSSIVHGESQFGGFMLCVSSSLCTDLSSQWPSWQGQVEWTNCILFRYLFLSLIIMCELEQVWEEGRQYSQCVSEQIYLFENNEL